ncbi:MAG: secondary thiamine-phosphate synthase enzyme YjbQ [Actinobacteria bacterium]|nr:secondary thiamine-phosphate synthase enzyme YjbQ [Actinomycetota bacterium]
MALKQTRISVKTEKGPYFVDITELVQKEVRDYTNEKGIVNLFLTGTTASLFINENEQNLLRDINNLFSSIVPQGSWNHDKLSFESNAHAHLRNIITNSSISIPFDNGKILLGTWQRIFLAEWDTRNRTREIIVTIIF